MSRRETLLQKWPGWEELFPGAFRYPKKLGVNGFEGDGSVTIISFDPSGDYDLTSPQSRQFYELLVKHGQQNAHLMDTYLVPFLEIGDREQTAKEVFLEQLAAAQPDAILVMDMTSWWRPETLESGFKGGNSFAWHKFVQWVPPRYPAASAALNRWRSADLVIQDQDRGCAIPCYRIYHYSHMRRGADKVKIWEDRFTSVLAGLGLLVPTLP